MRTILMALMMAQAMLLAMTGVGASAYAADAGKVLSISVEGNRYVEPETILAKMKTRVGAMLDRRKLSDDIRTLHKTGFFSDVRFTGQTTARGVDLICVVKEYPLIAKLEMEGNDEFPTKDLQLRMKLRPGRIFSPDNQLSDRNLLIKGYLKKGYYQVGIEFVPTQREDGRIDLLVKVDEGKVTHIRRIRFIGNKAFDDQTLARAIISRSSSLPAWFSDKDVFDKKRFGADGQMLQQYYLEHGYLDMAIESTQLVMSEDKQNFDLTFSLHEGSQYRVSALEVQGDLVPDKETLQEKIELEVGEVYALSDMQATIEGITDSVGDEGYAFASVTPLLNRNLDDHTVAIAFEIDKGEEVYIERLEIRGNDKSEDKLLRRQLKQDEGARYSGSQVRRSKEALMRNSYNEDVRVSFPRGSQPGKVKMKVDLTEKKSGKISGGIGWSQTEKLIFNASLSEDNLLGKGYQASVNGTYGKVTQDISASLADPYFLGMNMSAAISGFKRKTDPLNTVSYKVDSMGGTIGFGVPLSDYVSYAINYSYRSSNVTIVSAQSSILVQAQQGKQVTGEVIQSLTWDDRDRVVATREGSNHELRFGVAGAGGNNKFYEASAMSSFYFPVNNDKSIVINPLVEGKVIRGYGGLDIPLWRRYSLGSIGSMRGYDSLGISLRDPLTSEAIGGDKQLRASMNLFFPIPYIQTDGVRGVLYADAGTVWGKVNTTVGARTLNIVEPFALSRMRYSAGLGFEWISPIGPIGMVWSFPIHALPNDQTKSFEFALGGQF